MKKLYVYEIFTAISILGILFAISFFWSNDPDALGFKSPVTSIFLLLAICLFLIVFSPEKSLNRLSFANSLNALLITEIIIVFRIIGKPDAIIFVILSGISILITIKRAITYSRENCILKRKILLSLVPKILIVPGITMLIVF